MLVTTPAIVLHAFPYGDTSRIVRLATRDHGVQSVLAKGAARRKSPFSGGLQVMSAGTACFYLRAHRDLHTLSSFDVTTLHAELAADVSRYAAGAALAELVMRCSPAEPHPEIYHWLANSLDALATARSHDVPAVALAALWHLIVVLGFQPAVSGCVRCGGVLGVRARFSLSEGGLLCARCAGGQDRAAALGTDDQAALRAFVQGSTAIPALPAKHFAAHRRLLTRFVQRHVAEDREMKALAFWESLA